MIYRFQRYIYTYIYIYNEIIRIDIFVIIFYQEIKNNKFIDKVTKNT